MAARKRLHPLLPNLDNRSASDTETGLIDKITLKLSGAELLVHQRNDLRAYLELISNSPTGLFRRGRGLAQNILEIRDGWHLSGSIRFTKGWGLSVGDNFRYKAELHLNPSRFLAHNPNKIRHSNIITADDLKLSVMDADQLRELSLDGQDNFLSERQYVLVERNGGFLQLFRAYVQAIRRLIDEELSLPLLGAPSVSTIQTQESGPSLDWDVVRANDFRECQIAHSEIYWERWSTDALGAVRDIERIIGPTVRRISRMMFQVSDFVKPVAKPRNRELNSRSFSVDTGRRGIELLTYAKTWKRVRLELKYKRSLRRHLINKPPLEDQANWDGYVGDMLAAALEDAQRRIRPFFEELRRVDDGEQFGVAQLLDAFRRVIDACEGDQSIAAEVLTIIMQTDGITYPYRSRRSGVDATERDTKLRAAIRVLVQRNVLEPSQTQSRGAPSRRYTLALSFRNSMQRMRE